MFSVQNAHEMSHFSNALTEIVKHSFDSKWASLATKCSVDPSVISRLGAGKFEPTLDRLEQICTALNRHDRKQLLMASARDRVPAIYQDELFGDEDPASQLLRAKLSPDLAAVIRYLESNAMADELTASYLRRIGQWVGLTGSENTISLVADAKNPNPPPRLTARCHLPHRQAWQGKVIPFPLPHHRLPAS
jgi:transcriptional regulator with XRE-family HTH domain